MARDFNDILGDKIYTQPLESGPLPSPELLKNKFLIRARKMSDECGEGVGYVSGDDEGMEASEQVKILAACKLYTHFSHKVHYSCQVLVEFLKT